MAFNLIKTEQNQIAFNIFIEELETIKTDINFQSGPIDIAIVDSVLGRGWRFRGVDDWHGGRIISSIPWTEAPKLWERCQAEQTRIELQQMIKAQPRKAARSI